MPTPQDDFTRFTEARRDWLGEDWATIAERGNIQYQAIYRARNGRTTPTLKTKRGIETGLCWPRGTIDDILAGHGTDALITLPRTAPEQPDSAGHADTALQRTYDRILARRGKHAADQWLADTRELAGDTDQPNTRSDTA